jgi:uncharacterized protein with HEPN domain
VSARRTDADLLDDITQAAVVGAAIVVRGRSAFDEDPVLRYAAEAVAARIGEAASRLSAETTEIMSDVPWREMKGIRIVVAHVYHRISYDRLWRTLANDLPALLDAVNRYRHRNL